jgi:hypothetical protein
MALGGSRTLKLSILADIDNLKKNLRLDRVRLKALDPSSVISAKKPDWHLPQLEQPQLPMPENCSLMA